jgi:hypothetical protein
MPHFHYLEKDFNRNRKEPISEEEYQILKNQYEEFMEDILEKIRSDNKYALTGMFSPKVGLVMISISVIVFLALEFLLKKNDENWVDLLFIIALIIGVPGITIFFQGIRSWASLFDYRADLKKYYKYHKMLISKTEDYDEYLLLCIEKK